MPSWKKIIASGSDAELNSLNVTENVTASSLTGSLQTDIIQFTSQALIDGQEGQLAYSFDNGKLTFYTENDTPIELGRSIYVRIRNADTVTLTKGTIVDFTDDSTGQTPEAKRAIATSGADCSCFVGVIIKDTPVNEFGYMMLAGVLDGLNLSTFSTGDQVYLSQTVSGSFSTTIPTPPIKAIRIGKVLNTSASPTQGVLFIRPENRTVVFELAEFKQTYNTGSFSGSFTGDGSQLINLPIAAGNTVKFIQETPSVEWVFVHNLNEQYPVVTIYNSQDEVIIPGGIEAIDATTLKIYFDEPQSGLAAAVVGGSAVTASFSSNFNIDGTNLTTQEIDGIGIGTQVISQIDTGSFDSAFFDYRIKNGTDYRAGTLIAVWSGTETAFTDNSTADIGDTSPVVLSVDLENTQARLKATVTAGSWNIKTFTRAL